MDPLIWLCFSLPSGDSETTAKTWRVAFLFYYSILSSPYCCLERISGLASCHSCSPE